MRENPSGNRKLTDEQAVAVRVAYARGYKSSYQLAREYGMTSAGIFSVVQGGSYKRAGGPITWPDYCGANTRPLPPGHVRGRCRDVACRNPIAASGWAQRMHMCERCFRLNGGKKGRQREGRDVRATCKACHKLFSYYKVTSDARRRACSVACGALLSADKRRKRPPELTDEYLYELYWGRNLTAPEIAAHFGDLFTKDSVQLWLAAAHIPRRRAGSRTYSLCVVEGCGGEIHKLWNGERWYGRFCKPHLRERDRRRVAFYQEQVTQQRGLDVARVIRELLTGLPESVRADVESTVMVAVLSGELPPPLTREKLRPFIAEGFRENADAYKFLSLAAPTSTDEGAQTWGERLGLS